MFLFSVKSGDSGVSSWTKRWTFLKCWPRFEDSVGMKQLKCHLRAGRHRCQLYFTYSRALFLSCVIREFKQPTTTILLWLHCFFLFSLKFSWLRCVFLNEKIDDNCWNIDHVLQTTWKWSNWRLTREQDGTNVSLISHIHVRFLSCVISLIILPTLPSPSSAVLLKLPKGRRQRRQRGQNKTNYTRQNALVSMWNKADICAVLLPNEINCSISMLSTKRDRLFQN